MSASVTVIDPLALLADRLDPPDVDVFALLGYEPNCIPRIDARKQGVEIEPCGRCPQELFHSATEFDVLYGGAAGGGKTIALLMEGLRACVRWPGIRVGAFRRTFDELSESLLAELNKRVGDIESKLGCRFVSSPYPELRFRNGSEMRFRYLSSEKDATRRQGGQYQMVLLDERTLIPPAAVSILVDERVRTGDRGIPVIGIRSGTNPGGVGHGAVKDRYVNPVDDENQPIPTEQMPDGGLRYVDDHHSTVRFIPAKVEDNPHLMDADPGYLMRLDAIPDPARRKAMRDGDWDSFAGQFFGEWSRARHVVPAFTIPEPWARYQGIDWGYAAPWAVLWAARDPDGRMWVYREKYKTEVGEKDQARIILAAEGALTVDGLRRREPTEKIRKRLADPSMWARKGDANPIATTYAAEGVHLTPAQNERVNGWQRVHSYLADGPACEHHRQLGWERCPMLHVLEGGAPNLVRTLPNLPRDPDNVEDVDTDAEDHDADALRYLLMDLPVPSVARERRAAEDRSMSARAERNFERLANEHDKKRRRGGSPVGI